MLLVIALLASGSASCRLLEATQSKDSAGEAKYKSSIEAMKACRAMTGYIPNSGEECVLDFPSRRILRIDSEENVKWKYYINEMEYKSSIEAMKACVAMTYFPHSYLDCVLDAPSRQVLRMDGNDNVKWRYYF